MSKDKPEVGDVWEITDSFFHYRFYILEANPWSDYIEVISNSMARTQKTRDFFKKRCFTYIGKSKANIDDLFKTENEE